ncbi:MAG: hypothetical protein SynsKO_00580 [Synoicihabitans sp.]
MKTKTIIPIILSLAIFASPTLAATIEDERNEVRSMRDQVLADLYELKPNAEGRIKKAEGYAVFSNVGINLVFASFAGGHGVVVDDHGNETFMKMGSAGLGFGLGVKDFRGVFVFYDEEALENFVKHGWDFSAQADAAARSDDKGGQMAFAGNVHNGVEVYQFTENGLALQATLQGTKYWRDAALN